MPVPYKRSFIPESKQGVEKQAKAEALVAVSQAKEKSVSRGMAISDTAPCDDAVRKARGDVQ